MTVLSCLVFFPFAFLHNRAISIELQRNCVKEVSFLFPLSRCLGRSTGVVYNLFQNGRHFSILLVTRKLGLVASLRGKYSLEFQV